MTIIFSCHQSNSVLYLAYLTANCESVNWQWASGSIVML